MLISFLMLFISVNAFSTLEMKDLPQEAPVHENPLWNYQNKLLQVRGFWYTIEEGEKGILASRPNLKTCCIGSSLLAGQQLFINGNIAGLEPGRAVTLEGKFSINPLYNKEGELIQLYVLDQAQVVSSTSSSFGLFIGVIAVIMLVLGILILKKISHAK